MTIELATDEMVENIMDICRKTIRSFIGHLDWTDAAGDKTHHMSVLGDGDQSTPSHS